MSNLIKATETNEGQQTAVQSIEAIKSQINGIRELMRTVMKKDIHYGSIVKGGLPSLYKAGAELLISYFGLSLRTAIDNEERSDDGYWVRVKAQLYKNERLLGEAFGEASTNEEKYKWRKAVCDEEYDNTPENNRRIAYRTGQGGKVYKIKQIKVPVSDISNTVLKMAVKRAMVAVTRMVCGASEVWTEDLEDMPYEIVQDIASRHSDTPPQPAFNVAEKQEQPAVENQNNQDGGQEEGQTAKTQSNEQNGSVRKTGVITEKQRKRLFAIANKANVPNEHIKVIVKEYAGVEHTNDITPENYELVCQVLENYQANLQAGVIDKLLAKHNKTNERPF